MSREPGLGWRGALAPALLLALVAGAVVAWLAPAAESLRSAPASTAVYDREGRLLRLALAADGRFRVRAPLSAYPEDFVGALLMKEDRWFYLHPGVNPYALARAAWHSLVARDYQAGASTITMQLARLLRGYDTRTLGGKLSQIVEALRLELACGKGAILEAYLSRAPCGGNVEGFETAALVYFGRPLAQISFAEALLLANLPQRPSLPRDGTPDRALLEARDRLFGEWRAAHPGAGGGPESLRLPVALRVGLPFEAPHAVDALLAAAGPERPPRIDSTIDLDLQRLLEKVLSGYVERRRAEGIRNAAALLVDSRSMEVLAEVGSADFHDVAIEGQVDGTRAKRSPGSALKPFLYGLALDEGIIHPATVLKDAPIHFSGYNPDNFDNDFEGPIRAAEALVRSRNVPAVWLAGRVHDPDFHGFLRKSGVAGLRDRDWYGVSLVLGTAEVTMREAAALYAMLARGGSLAPLRDRLGDPVTAGTPLLSPEASWLVLDILGRKPRPPGSDNFLSDAGLPPCAWKTGTSIGFRDAWSIGVSGRLVLAVWAGNFDGRGDPSLVGLSAAGPLMFEILDALAASGRDFGEPAPRPGKLAKVEVCAESGGIPNEYCPRRFATWFIPGVSPIDRCEVHQLVVVDRASGLRVGAESPGRTRSEVMEVWPSDLAALFAKAGLPRRLPPPFAEGEGSGGIDPPGLEPQILSPLAKSEYVMREAPGTAEMPLSCVVSSEVSRVYWFLDETYLGSSRRGETFFWAPRPGEFQLRVVDDRGRAATCRIKIVAGSGT